ncbi:MAG TPA: helix-turn-helix domain-containing protein [Thermodesulfobacteriota bacterium]|nr:helix-turn-helix domain-containing protein [Thermodesulfobacteriota bacterium]
MDSTETKMVIKYAEVIERMRWAGRLKNDSAVARLLGVTPQALSNYKKRNRMPADLVLKFANVFGLSLDWLISGEGEMYRYGVEGPINQKRGPYAAEESAAYLAAKKGLQVFDAGTLSPEEIIYVGKLLKILRGADRSKTEAIKNTVDAFAMSSYTVKAACS